MSNRPASREMSLMLAMPHPKRSRTGFEKAEYRPVRTRADRSERRFVHAEEWDPQAILAERGWSDTGRAQRNAAHAGFIQQKGSHVSRFGAGPISPGGGAVP